MKILVTGSAGFIGFHLCRRLLREGHQLAGVDAMVPYYDPRLKEKRHSLLIETNRFRPHIVDISDMAAIRGVIEAEAPEIVIHLAAQPGVRYGLQHPEGYVSANVTGSFNLLEICRQRPVQHFLMASTSSVYGANSKMPFQETDPTDTPLSIYAATKRSAEAIAHSYAHLWNQPITVFRFFTVYGPWGRPDMAFFKFTAAILKGEPIDVHNHGRMERDFTYIDDLIEAIVRLIPKRPVRGEPVNDRDSLSPVAPYRVVNIGNGAPVNLMDFIAAIEAAVGKPAKRNYVDMQPGESLKTWASPDLLEALTGFRPNFPIAKGIREFVAWYREYYGI
jgi:UDP-glucuronate 4-epimerase